MLSKGLCNYTNLRHKFLYLGSIPPPPFYTMCKKKHPIWQRTASLTHLCVYIGKKKDDDNSDDEIFYWKEKEDAHNNHSGHYSGHYISDRELKAGITHPGPAVINSTLRTYIGKKEDDDENNFYWKKKEDVDDEYGDDDDDDDDDDDEDDNYYTHN